MRRALARTACVGLAVAVFPFSAAMADMYKCTVDGKTVYQDRPCPSTGTAISIKPATGKPSGETTRTAEDNLVKTKAQVAEMELERKKRDIAYEIERLEADIDGYERAQESELSALRRKKGLAKNNLAGATWEQSISAEMQAVTEKYKTKIQVARDRIAQLRQDAAEIGKSR